MPFLIGTDEAGYGPNLGPLVISATLWQLPHKLLGKDLYPCFDPVILKAVSACENGRALAVADSKLLYKPGGGLAGLERGLFPLLYVTGKRSDTWRDFWPLLDPASPPHLARIPWYAEFESPLPIDVGADEIAQLITVVSDKCHSAGIHCRRIQSSIVFPEQLNDGIDQHGNKATVLSLKTLELIATLVDPIGDEPILIHCDKHGGRNMYGPLLQQVFPEYLVEVVHESRQQSTYRWGPPARRIEIHFTAKGENCIASALASMASKYLRELAMRAFNQFWSRHVPGVRPTAGYPADAKRFRDAIAAMQHKLAIADRVLWRNK